MHNYIQRGVLSGTRSHKMEDHNMGVARKKITKTTTATIQINRKIDKKNIKGMYYDFADHSAQFLAKNIWMKR